MPALAAAIILAIFAALFAIDPEARYAARYADNRRSALLVGEPVAEGDPAQLSDLDLARAIALAWMRAHRPARLRWSWEEAVAVDGLLAWGERTGDARPRAYARAWIAAHAEEALSAPLWADAAAPASAALAVSRGPGSVEEEIVARVAAYVREGAPRTRAGALSHPGALLGGAIPAQAWVDSLYMHGGFLVRLAAAREEPWAAEEARALAHAVVESLQDEGTGLFRHAAIDLGPLTIRLPVEPAFWARGNAWAAWFLTEHAIARRARDLPPDERTEAARVRLQSALLDRQDPESGLWRTELDGRDASNPVETSASALILASLRRSLAHDLAPDAPRAREAAARAARGLRACIRWVGGHPILTGVSTGTHPAHRAYYRAVPLDENVGHGVGAALLALTAS